MAVESLAWALPPAVTNAADGSQAYNMGLRFTTTEDMPCPGIVWRVPDAVTVPPLGEFVVSLWQEAGALRVRRAAFVPTPGVDQQVLFDTPFTLEAGLSYIAAVYTITYVYRASGNVYPSTPSGKLSAVEGRLVAYNGGPDTMPSAFPNSATGLLFYVSPLVGTVDSGPPAAAPTGLAIPASLGQPTTGLPGTAPAGLAVTAALGTPAVALNRSAAPAGLTIPVALGQPSAAGAAATPAGLTIPLGLGTPAASVARAATPVGLPIPVALGAPSTVLPAATSAPTRPLLTVSQTRVETTTTRPHVLTTGAL